MYLFFFLNRVYRKSSMSLSVYSFIAFFSNSYIKWHCAVIADYVYASNQYNKKQLLYVTQI